MNSKKNKQKEMVKSESAEEIKAEYPMDAKRRRFQLKKEKDPSLAQVTRIKDQRSLIDGLNRIQRDEEERELLYDQIIVDHKIAERQLYLYNNPQTGGLKPDEIVKADNNLSPSKDSHIALSASKD